MIADALNTGFTRAIGTAVKGAVGLDAVPDDFAIAMMANRRELVNRALEAIEDVPVARCDDLERQVIFVATDFALSH